MATVSANYVKASQMMRYAEDLEYRTGDLQGAVKAYTSGMNTEQVNRSVVTVTILVALRVK